MLLLLLACAPLASDTSKPAETGIIDSADTSDTSDTVDTVDTAETADCVDEVCDGIDNDCDGEVDEGVTQTGWRDADGDIYGDPSAPGEGCGYVDNQGDCDDTNAEIHPYADEFCDGVDTDCDGVPDNGVTLTWFPDEDGDGWGGEYYTKEACTAPDGYVATPGDCEDDRADISPDAEEVRNGYDDDCDGEDDEGLTTVWFGDFDGDGYGDSRTATEGCQPGDNWVEADGDCDEDDPSVNPGAAERCDGTDNDCDGSVDEGC